ncbi:alpha/beta hydrolase [Pyxidicoccus parkwayensis]|uniref:Alpha/beta hydrolase n=1 Tax=Pyxidicoccus parkwayensis TaxID=2813578 RepID=A0ABX7P8M7_9BACT|nr:alpha/beta hydrolase [Pyxidicoccus parkwaysis]
MKRVTVAEGVELEVLDFGGQGPALVFLAGLGCTGHVFDDLAPEFTANRHVYAFTRRGFGASSWPEKGYDTATLGTDVVRALDGLGIAKASLAGHSLAGDELTWVAARYPERVEKLVYLDSAVDHARVHEVLSSQPPPPSAEPEVAPEQDPDLASRAAWSAALARDSGGRFPNDEIEQAYDFDPKTGRGVGIHARPDAFAQVMSGSARMDFSGVRAPVLAFYARPRATGLERMTPARQEALKALILKLDGVRGETEAALRKVPGTKVVMFENGQHFVWFSNHAEVVREMKAFLGQ